MVFRYALTSRKGSGNNNNTTTILLKVIDAKENIHNSTSAINYNVIKIKRMRKTKNCRLKKLGTIVESSIFPHTGTKQVLIPIVYG